jgi:hypothetical protein
MVYKQAWSIKNYRYIGDISLTGAKPGKKVAGVNTNKEEKYTPIND